MRGRDRKKKMAAELLALAAIDLALELGFKPKFPTSHAAAV
jgi:hypothetical protein